MNIKEWAIKDGLDAEQAARFERLYQLLVDYNQRVNLTAITEESAVYTKHFLDSLACAKMIGQGARVIDIGAGAGFPSLPLLIVRGDLDMVMLDSVAKKLKFVEYALKELGLKGRVVHARCEDYARECGASFDAAVCRAVAPLSTLVEYALPLLKKGGKFFAYKTDGSEVESAKGALKTLNGSAKVHDVSFLGLTRAIIEVVKVGDTPKQYPRTGNRPRTNPL